MSLQSFKKMLETLRGAYTFNFANEDDCAYLFEEYGGEERMKTAFPAIYQSFLKAREEALRNERDEIRDNALGGAIGAYSIKFLNAPDNGDNSWVRLSVPVGGLFLDAGKEVNSVEPAEPWPGMTVQTMIKEKFSPNCLAEYSEVVTGTNSYEILVESNPEFLSEIGGKCYSFVVDFTGTDPKGTLRKLYLADEQDVGTVIYRTIANIKVTDPAPQNDQHRASNEIVMLYGRTNQQDIFKDADYKEGDFLSNTFANGKVHLLIPLSGEVVFDYNVHPQELYKPTASEALSRSEATYNYKKQKFYYRKDVDDSVLYAELKKCFQQDEYVENRQTAVKFDIKIPDTGRSAWDWHVDVEGLANGDPKTVFLKGCFTYQSINQLGIKVRDQITIESVTRDNLKKLGAEYYTYDAAKARNTLYIPPITIYWGCFGKDVEILMADRTKKRALDIRIGDRLLGHGDEVLTVDNVCTGYDTAIYTIGTRKGGRIQVSGGHPMLCKDKSVRASQLRPGDPLTLAEGGFDEVTDIAVVDYNDTVYNFTFEGVDKGVYLVANGFYAGDLRMQNENAPCKEKVYTPEEKMLIAEMTLHCKEINEAGRRR
jgi:hypothetical protein